MATKLYSVFDLYEKIEKLQKGEKIKVATNNLYNIEFKQLDQTYFINHPEVKNHYLFRFDQITKVYKCINCKYYNLSI